MKNSKSICSKWVSGQQNGKCSSESVNDFLTIWVNKIHIGTKCPIFTYIWMVSELLMTNQERDLGIMVDSSFEMSAHHAAAVKKTDSMLGIVRKGIENKL